MYRVGYNEHIVNLQGITVSHEDCRFFLVLEYCSKGSLYEYLIGHKEKFHYALANHEYAPPSITDNKESEEVQNFNQLIAWSYQVSRSFLFADRTKNLRKQIISKNCTFLNT